MNRIVIFVGVSFALCNVVGVHAAQKGTKRRLESTRDFIATADKENNGRPVSPVLARLRDVSFKAWRKGQAWMREQQGQHEVGADALLDNPLVPDQSAFSRRLRDYNKQESRQSFRNRSDASLCDVTPSKRSRKRRIMQELPSCDPELAAFLVGNEFQDFTESFNENFPE